MGTNAVPLDDNGKPVLGLYNDATGKVIPVHVGAIVTGADGQTYAKLDVNATVSPAANQRVNAQSGDFVAGAITDLATLLTLSGTPTDANTVNSLMGRLTKIRDLLNAFTDTSASGTVVNDGDVVSIALPGGQATAIVNILMGTLVGTLLFEVSPDSGTTWTSVIGNLSGTSTSGTSTTSAGVWRFNVSGYTNFRIRLHPTTSGTSGTITLRLSQGVHNVFINNASPLGQQTKSASAPVVIASDQIVPINGGYVDLATTVTGLSNGSNVVGPIDVSGYTWGCFQATGTYSMSLTFQGSMDSSNWVNIPWTSIAQTTEQTPTATYGAVTTIYHGPLVYRYFRVSVSGYTSNTSLNAYCRVFANPPAMLPMTQNVLVIPTTTGGTTSHHRISTADTNLVNAKSGAGQVYGGDFSNNGASDAWVKFFNKATAPVIGTDTVVKTVYLPKGTRQPYINFYGFPFSVGISYAITGGAADADTTAIGAAQVTLDLDYK